MKHKTLFLSIVIMTILIFSCKQNENLPAPTPAIIYPNYSQLKVGNYWIYEQFDISATGVATSKNKFDSCYVEKDTVINHKTYFKIINPRYYAPSSETLFQRDSLHYIVDLNGRIIFSSQDFTNILFVGYKSGGINDTISKIVRKMTDKDLSVTTAAGTFVTSNVKDTSYMYPPYSYSFNLTCLDKRYAENVGIVIETLPFFLASRNYIERRLVRYHLN